MMITYNEETVHDPFEVEIEYDRLCDALTGRGADTMAIRIHASQQQLAGSSKLAHLHAVSELAGRHADTFYNDADFNMQRYHKMCCKLSGLLHEVMEWGGAFEQVVEVTDETVARMVSDLTPDKRIPRPKRRRLYFNQVGLAKAPTQLVKLADLQHEAHQLLTLSEKDYKSGVVEAIKHWVDDAVEVLPLLDKIKTCYPLIVQFSKLKSQLEELGDRCTKLLVSTKRIRKDHDK